MLGLITMLISTLGAAGMGSVLKVFAGIIDRIGAAKEKGEQRELVRDLERTKLNIEVQKMIFGGNGENAKYSRGTRRVMAVITGLTFSAVTLICTIWPSVPLVTWATSGGGSSISLFWGLITVPTALAGTTVVITTGHIVLLSMAIMGAVFGWYFTPSGRN
jgi:hypothetical protein